MSEAHDPRLAILRYFNVAGADPKVRFGQSGSPLRRILSRLLPKPQLDFGLISKFSLRSLSA
jgi:UDP-glucose 4-epimerase